MSCEGATVVNAPGFVSFSEMDLLRTLIQDSRRPNVLIVCAGSAVETVVDELRLVCRPPFHVCHVPGALDLRGCGTGTLVLHDVAGLTIGQQIGLFDWIDRPRRDVQIVSLTHAPLAPLVRDGCFLEGLFYRLNTLSMTATWAA
jgi:hypothetical protein